MASSLEITWRVATRSPVASSAAERGKNDAFRAAGWRKVVSFYIKKGNNPVWRCHPLLPAFLPSCASRPLGGIVTLDGQLLSTSLQRVPVLRQGQLLGFGGLKFAMTQVLENGR